ncbi:MAG: hypothetical protein RL292_218 [Candidatus Parcubacteria bacterium]|jgi:hypothetical protein
MKHNGIYYLKLYSLIILGVTIIGYSIFQAQKILGGPKITVLSPINGATYTTALIEIKGVAKNTSTLLLNDRPLYTDKAGNFSDTLLPTEGYNIIKLEAKDKFGARTEERIEIIYKPI